MLCFALALWNGQDTLLKELGGNMITAESALAAHNFKSERIIMGLVEDHTVK